MVISACKKLLLYAALVLFVAVPVTATGNGGGAQKHFIWRVASKSAMVFILGSVHLAKADLYPLPQVMENSFAKSSVLALEADPASANDGSTLGMMLSSAIYPEGETIRDRISPETYDLVRREAEKSGLPLETMERTRPWFMALTLESFELLRLGFDPSYGIDMHFAREAEGTKKVVELESFDYQVNLLSGLSAREQELFLLFTLKDLSSLASGIDDLMQAWQSGDSLKLETMVTRSLRESPQLAPIYDKLFFRRNRQMTDKIEAFLRGRETVFVVVGAAHLVGDNGIIELLRRKGFRVEQL